MTADADMPVQALAPMQDLTELDQIAAAVTSLPALPSGSGTRYGPRPLTAAWLASMGSRHTRRAYFADLTDLLACATATASTRWQRDGPTSTATGPA
jgi:hypothetical protein